MEKHTIGLHEEKILLLKRNSGETNNIFFEGNLNKSKTQSSHILNPQD